LLAGRTFTCPFVTFISTVATEKCRFDLAHPVKVNSIPGSEDQPGEWNVLWMIRGTMKRVLKTIQCFGEIKNHFCDVGKQFGHIKKLFEGHDKGTRRYVVI
jgi:hypothetical protein